MAVMQGKVTKGGRFITVAGKRRYMPKGCDPIIGPQLAKVAGRDVEVLVAKDVVLAVRVLEWKPELKIPRIIVCYLCPPHIVFNEEILRAIEPPITRKLVQSGYLAPAVAEQLNEWTAARR